MGKSQKEKAAHNDYCRTQATAYQSRGDQYEAERAANQAKLDRLKEAKDKLDAQIKAYGTFQTNVNSALQANVSEGSFKGDRKDKFDQTVAKVDQAITDDLNKHQRNAARLGAEITAYSAKVGDLQSAASGAWEMAKNFWNSLW